jgi:FAD/FMN-containing dehydrogenase
MVDQTIVTTHGTPVTLSATKVERFASGLAGSLLRRSDRDYDQARRVWNAMVDKRPALIARCAGTADVVASVRFAREHDLLISVRGGGHNYAGKSVCEGGLMIDLSPMKGIIVDPGRQTARADAGLRLGEFDQATQAHGLATTLGVNTDTGIAGLTLGGGYGWLGGRFGLACDNLLAAEVVTADGRQLTASADENSDLFWGLRGAGANLGIVTRFDYRLHPIGQVLGGMVIYPMSNGRAALRLFDDFADSCPDEVSCAGLLLSAPDGAPAVAIAVCYTGPLDKGEDVLAPLTRSIPVLANLLEVQPYTMMQTLFDAAWPSGRRYYNKSSITRRLSAGAIEVLVEYGATLPTNLSAIAFQQLHGAASRIGVADTAFPHRFDHLSMYVHPATDNPAESNKIVAWGRRCWQDMQPFMEDAVYVNGLEDAQEEGEQRVLEAYGANHARIAALKATFDPTNFLSGNQNVTPAASVMRRRAASD